MWSFTLFTIAGISSVVIGIRILTKAKRANTWPTVSGVITISERSKDSESQSKVVYAYTVNGIDYTSERVLFGDQFGYSGFDRNAKANEYPVGKSIEVRYNPELPSESVVELGVAIGAILAVILGVMFILIGTGPYWWDIAEPYLEKLFMTGSKI